MNAPRITLADIEDKIASTHYITPYTAVNPTMEVVPDALKNLTICILVLKNGFTVTGEAACVSLENFDAVKGMQISREAAINKLWPLMGYELKERLYRY